MEALTAIDLNILSNFYKKNKTVFKLKKSKNIKIA